MLKAAIKESLKPHFYTIDLMLLLLFSPDHCTPNPIQLSPSSIDSTPAPNGSQSPVVSSDNNSVVDAFRRDGLAMPHHLAHEELLYGHVCDADPVDHVMTVAAPITQHQATHQASINRRTAKQARILADLCEANNPITARITRSQTSPYLSHVPHIPCPHIGGGVLSGGTISTPPRMLDHVFRINPHSIYSTSEPPHIAHVKSGGTFETLPVILSSTRPSNQAPVYQPPSDNEKKRIQSNLLPSP